MRLISFRVTNYKSIEDSGEVQVGRVTCHVGKNEAGKTALLEALGKLKPVEGLSAQFVLEDYCLARDVDLQKKLLDPAALKHFENAFRQLNGLIK